MCHNNGIKAYILVGYKHFDDYHDDTIPGDVLDFWIKHSYEVIEVYSNERVNNDYPHLENTFDELVKHIHVGDILWTKPTSFVKEQHLKRLGFHYDQNYLIYTFQKS